MNTQTARELTERYLMTTYRRIPVAFAHGQGGRLTDLEGKPYLDFIAGIAVSVLGHNHPAVTAALQAQAARPPAARQQPLSHPRASRSRAVARRALSLCPRLLL